ncbi:MAG: hypothetical protein FJ100_23210 [Deltaproteobacteria bacterium]|nr:hypothetical protein [Deltaproteobacteria bacterium]
MAPLHLTLIAALTVATLGCGASPGTTGGGAGTTTAGAGHCTRTQDCDDGNTCTTDTCSPASSTCQHIAIAGCAVPCDKTHPCGQGVCHPATGTCVACTQDTECPASALCAQNTCHQAKTCASDLDCKAVDGVCVLPKGLCVQCLTDADCAKGSRCRERQCVALQPCSSSKECPKLCDKVAGHCVECEASTDCGSGLFCDANRDCAPVVCSAGACQGNAFFACRADGSGYNKATSCESGQACATDTCGPQGCNHAPASGPCNDGDTCTKGDTCEGGKCVGSKDPCDDGKPCTTDTCAPLSGCKHASNTFACDDGNPCTTQDHCKSGECGGTKVSCDDGDACTADSCAPSSGCAHQNSTGGACSDGDACSADDTCVAGVCKGAAVSCDDGNVCTSDACNAKSGCAHVPEVGLCSDGNPCTDADECDAGACVGMAKNCGDGVACTVDACAAGIGCKNTATDGLCDDKNQCTDDLCAADKGCVNLAISATCSDGDACTVGDVCVGGKCAGGSAPGCDDGNGCTDDSCQPKVGCVHMPNTQKCDDGQSCTTMDTCSGGVCAGKPKLYEKIFGGSGTEVARSIVALDDGYAIGGATDSKGAGGTDMWLVRTDAAGVPLWDKTYGDAGEDMLRAVASTPDGFVLAGSATVGCSTDASLIKTGLDGAIVWKKTYGAKCTNNANIAQEAALAVVPVQDGYVALGMTSSKGANSTNYWLFKVDQTGALVWDWAYGQGTFNLGSALTACDGGFAFGGHSYGNGDSAWAARTDAGGKLIWSKSFGSLSTLRSIVAIPSGFVLAGDSFVIGTDLDGNVLWQRSGYGGTAMVGLPDGFALAGYGGVLRIDSLGNVLWTTALPASVGRGIGASKDGLAVVGDWAKGINDEDIKLVRTDLFGNTSCGNSGSCASLTATACNDTNPCTADLCTAAKAGCYHANLPGGTPCGTQSVCKVGVCGP